MKFRVTMKKDPAALVCELPDDGEAPQEGRLYDAPDAVRDWFEPSECVEIEIDTEAGTAVLVKPRK